MGGLTLKHEDSDENFDGEAQRDMILGYEWGGWHLSMKGLVLKHTTTFMGSEA